MNDNINQGGIMELNTNRFNELYQAELRLSACGCGGACSSCQAEPRPASEEECDAFEVRDDTEIQSDYIVNEHIRVLPTHPRYAEVLVACLAREAHDAIR